MGIVWAAAIYLMVGYAIAIVAACADARTAERTDLMALKWVFGWGLYAVVLGWRIACIPISIIRRARFRMRAINEQ